MRQPNSPIGSITMCAICIMKEEGILDPEDYVLNQYSLSTVNGGLPIPLDPDMGMDGVALLNFENPTIAEKAGRKVAQVGGLIGTVQSAFRALGFLPKEDEPEVSTTVVKTKRKGGGLYGERVK